MDTRLVVRGRIAIEPGHRIEITEAVDAEAVGAEAEVADTVGVGLSLPPGVIALIDLDTGVRYQVAEGSRIPVRRWTAHVVDCLVLLDGPHERTVLTVTPVEGERSGAGDALRDASAAVDAAKAEAARWGGSAPPSQSSPQRIW